jgi:hypothetical protein
MSARMTLVAAVLSVGLVACQGSGEPPPLTKAQLIQQGDALCRTAQDEIDQLPGDLTEPTTETVDRWAEVLGQLQPIYQTLVTGLDELSPPESEATAYDEMVAEMQKANASLQAAVQAAGEGDVAGTKEAFTTAADHGGTSEQMATDLGFTDCGSN